MCVAFRVTKGARIAAVSAGTLFAILTSAAGQASGAGQAPGDRQAAAAHEITIGGQSPPAPNIQQCVDVQIGGDQAFGCLNQQLKREVERVNPPLNLPPLDARSPDVRVGNVNEAAVRQQYGSNYGRSVIPFRPPSAGFVVPHH
jgi:hypothetical protein